MEEVIDSISKEDYSDTNPIKKEDMDKVLNMIDPSFKKDAQDQSNDEPSVYDDEYRKNYFKKAKEWEINKLKEQEEKELKDSVEIRDDISISKLDDDELKKEEETTDSSEKVEVEEKKPKERVLRYVFSEDEYKYMLAISDYTSYYYIYDPNHSIQKVFANMLAWRPLYSTSDENKDAEFIKSIQDLENKLQSDENAATLSRIRELRLYASQYWVYYKASYWNDDKDDFDEFAEGCTPLMFIDSYFKDREDEENPEIDPEVEAEVEQMVKEAEEESKDKSMEEIDAEIEKELNEEVDDE